MDGRKSHVVVGISSNSAGVDGVESGCGGINANHNIDEGSHKGM